MKVVCLALGIFMLQSLQAQRTVNVDNGNSISPTAFYTVSGTPFVVDKYIRIVDGSPYFRDSWMDGRVVTQTGGEIKNLSLRLDLLENEIHYKDKDANELITTTPLKEVVVTDSTGAEFRFVHSSGIENSGTQIREGWYNWLVTGQASLFRAFKKQISESKPYGSATTEQRIQTVENYFVQFGGVVYPVKKLKDVPGILSNKQAELEKFLQSSDNKNLPMEERFKALINYYNSLVQK